MLLLVWLVACDRSFSTCYSSFVQAAFGLPGFAGAVILIGCALFALQQLSGINSVFYFSSSIFKHAGITSEVVASMAVGIANLAAAILSTYLIDRAGRKSLLLSSFNAMVSLLDASCRCHCVLHILKRE